MASSAVNGAETITAAREAKENAITEQDNESEQLSDKKTSSESASAPASGPRRVSLRLSTLVTGGVLAAVVAVAVVLGVLLIQARADLSNRDAAAADQRHAEQVATDYAVGAATINYQDFPTWIGKLKANTTPQLANKFDATAAKLQQILGPLKWTSNATPIAAKVQSVDGSIYKVDVFVTVNSTTAQTPDGTQTTVTYNTTVDKQSGWKVTDVGGVVTALAPK